MIYSSPQVYSFGKKKTRETIFSPSKINKNSLGPGEYNIERPNSAYCFSFSKNPRMKKIKDTTPGPGEYAYNDYGLFGKNTPSYTMSKSKRISEFAEKVDKINGINNNFVGPGFYDVDNNNYSQKNRNNNSSIFKSNQKRIPNIKNDNPGPGEYYVDKYYNNNNKNGNFGRKKKETIFDLAIKNNKDKIGPGYYDNNNNNISNINNNNNNKSNFSKEKKFFSFKNTNPGVGSYNINNNNNKNSIKFSSVERKDIFNVEKNSNAFVGPGAYYSMENDHNHIQGGVFSKEEKMKMKDNKFPGVGEYNYNNSENNNNGIAFNKSKKESIFNVKNDEEIGPGMYDNNNKESTIAYSFSNLERFVNKNNGVPGPGYYKIPCSIHHVPDFADKNINEEFKYV